MEDHVGSTTVRGIGFLLAEELGKRAVSTAYPAELLLFSLGSVSVIGVF